MKLEPGFKALLIRNIHPSSLSVVKIEAALLGVTLETYVRALVEGTWRRFTAEERNAAVARLDKAEADARAAGKAIPVLVKGRGKGKAKIVLQAEPHRKVETGTGSSILIKEPSGGPGEDLRKTKTWVEADFLSEDNVESAFLANRAVVMITEKDRFGSTS